MSKKRIVIQYLFVVVTFTLVVLLGQRFAMASSHIWQGEYEYSLRENGTAHICSVKGSLQGDVYIPDRVYVDGKNYTITSLESNLFLNMPIRRLHIGEHLQFFGKGIFEGCNELQQIYVKRNENQSDCRLLLGNNPLELMRNIEQTSNDRCDISVYPEPSDEKTWIFSVYVKHLHSYGNWEVEKEAEVGKTGGEVLRCAGCDYVYLRQVTPALEQSTDLLKGKVLVGIGDSLMQGDQMRRSNTWLNKIGLKYEMEVHNHGSNGNTVAICHENPQKKAMCERIDEVVKEHEHIDYFMIEGGANDYTYRVPVGKLEDTAKNTFVGALRYMINQVKKTHPEAKIYCLGPYNRYHGKENRIGFKESNYEFAARNLCKSMNVLYYDNYYNAMLDFSNEKLLSWCDEGVYFGHSANQHLSPVANDYLVPFYASFLLQKEKPVLQLPGK